MSDRTLGFKIFAAVAVIQIDPLDADMVRASKDPRNQQGTTSGSGGGSH